MEPRIDDEPQILHPGPLDESLLTRQRYHRSEDIWNGEDPGPLTCRGRTKEMASIQMGDNRIVWQPYEADFGHLPDFCVAGRDTWTFGLAQERPDHVVYDEILHIIDLRGKVEKNWREENGPYILTWDVRRQRLCHAPPQTGEMPRDHHYYCWYRPVTRKYVDRNSAKLDISIESHLALLEMLPDTKAALCTMMSLRMMPRSLLPRPNITRGLKNAKLVNLEKEVCYRGS
ncbi:hypothetical protein CMV_003941 [Castanea mollissima]|uniref:Uncharacterized protein n=1 Tax=Castanea mollissima TaxID=60419 RepID=A0A8J4RYV8_9ROSI|nr:hypothetical protein CMV_003941 [Castanea mollissima]